MNNVLIDFTPDTINNEYQVDSFASLFDGSPLSQSNQFLNYDASDTTIDSDDAKIAASRIASKVRQHLLTFEKDPTINLRVLYTPDILSPTDPGTGERWLQNGQQAAQENTYVIYVGAGRPSENLPKYGLSHQAYSGRNNEFYGFAFAGGIADLLSSGEFRWKTPANLAPVDFTNSVAFTIVHELGHLWGLGHVADSEVYPGTLRSPDNYHHVMNSLSQADPASARLLADATHQMAIGDPQTQSTTFSLFNADQEVRDSLRTDASNNFLQETIPNAGNPNVPTYLAALGGGLEEGTPPEPPTPRADAPPASQGTLGSLTAADIADQFDAGFDVYVSEALNDFANRLDYAAGTLPLVDGNFSSSLGLIDALQSTISTIDVDSASTMADLADQLGAAGFEIDDFVSDAELVAMADDQPADLIRATRTYSLVELAATSGLNQTGLSGISALGGINFSGDLDLLADLYFTVAVGVDTAGFYLLPGNGLTGRFAIGGNISADFGVLSRATGGASVAFNRSVLLTNPRTGQSGDDGRLRLADLTAALTGVSTVDVDGSASINVLASVSRAANESIEISGRWIWDLAADGSGFTLDAANAGFDEQAMVDQLVDSVGEALNSVADQSGIIVSETTRRIPFIGAPIAAEMEPLLTQQLRYDNTIGSGQAYLESKGFTIDSFPTAAQLINGTYSTGGDVLRLRFQSDSVYDINPLAAEGTLEFSDQGVPIEFSLAGTVDVDPTVSVDMRFGMDWFGGPYLMEGASWKAVFPTNASLTGGIDLGELDAVEATAAVDIDATAEFVFSDFDSTGNERIFLSDLSVGAFAWDFPQSVRTLGQMDLALDLSVNASTIPIIGDYLTDVLTWNADASYSFEGNGTFDIDENSVGGASSLLGGIETQLKDRFLGLVDQYNPLPQGLRDFLTLKIEILGNQSIIDLVGLGEAEILINPLATAGQTNSGTEQDHDHVLLNYDIADPHNVLALLSGQPAELFSLDIDKTFGPSGLSFPIVQDVVLASYFGALNALLDLNGTVEMGVSFDLVLGLDTKGFYLVDDLDPLMEVTGRIAADPTISLALANVDFARILGSIGLEAIGGIDVNNPDSSSTKIRASDLFTSGQLNTEVLNVSLAFDLDWSLYGELGGDVGLTSTTETYEDRVRLYELTFGAGQPRGDAFDEISRDMERRVDQLVWCGAAAQTANIVAIAGCAYYSLPDLEEIGQQVADYANEKYQQAERYARQLGGDAAAKGKAFLNDVNDFVSNIGGHFATLTSGVSLSNLSSVFGQGSWESVAVDDPTQTFIPHTQDGLLILSWNDSVTLSPGPFPETGRPSSGTIDQANPLAANLTVEYDAVLGTIIIDAPDFVTREIVAERKSGCYDGCETEYRYENFRWPNRYSIPISSPDRPDITKVVFHGTEFDDRLIASPNMPFAVEMYGLGGNDQLVGTIYDDYLAGNSGNDLLQGRGGNDTLDGGDHDDELYGDYGSDWLIGGDGNDTLNDALVDDGPINDGFYVAPDRSLEENRHDGNAGDDRLYGSPGIDIQDGGFGQDHLFGYGGNDILRGGPETATGYDPLLEADVLNGGSGSDTLYGGIGDDLLDGGDGDDPMLDGGADNDAIRGGQGIDHLFGRDGSDFLEGGDNNDFLYGGHAGDILRGGNGDDWLVGATVDDIEAAGDGNDAIYGGPGNDTLFGGPSGPGLQGGPTDVPIATDILEGDSGRDHLYGGTGPDRINGGSDFDVLMGQQGDDVLSAGSGSWLPLDVYSDSLLGGQGNDELYGSSSRDGLKGSYLDGGLDDDQIASLDGPDYVIGGFGADSVLAAGGDDLIFGHRESSVDDDAAADVIDSGPGDDDVRAGLGNDTVLGGPGNDLLYGSGGDDSIDGQAGDDRILGGAGDDIIQGGDDEDLILGEAGNDNIDGGSGPDRLEGGLGNDSIAGGLGDDLILGQQGADDLDGGFGNDHVDGGDGIDVVRGGPDNDVVVAGSGIGDHLFGNDGDDTIVGSSEGAPTDPDFFDSTFFGDVIDGGDGNDLVFGLGGADLIRGRGGNDRIESGSGSDYVLGGDDDDWIFVGHDLGEKAFGGLGNDTLYGSHGGNDELYGDEGDDDLFGQGGDDSLWGGAGADRLDGGGGTDHLQGQQGNDELIGGGGAGDLLEGGPDDDVIRGSDDGADLIRAGSGRDIVFGGGGNDQIFGDEDDDILHGGPGDDVIEGGPGRDLITGDADHDVLYGHAIGNLNDDNAVDYLYGDFATNRNEIGSGQDRLYGGGGNDQLFGEAGDDLIDAGSGGDDRVDYGTGESAIESDFQAPDRTGDPTVTDTLPAISSTEHLPTGGNVRGRWSDFAGSGSGQGIGTHDSGASQPSVIVAGDGTRYVAWVDGRHGNEEIYVAKHTDVGGWQSLGGSADGGGISDSLTPSTEPSLAIDPDGNVVVSWTQRMPSGSDIHVSRFDSATQSWTHVGGSRNVSSTGSAEQSKLLSSPNGLVLGWLDKSSGAANAFLRRFDGTQWQSIAGSDSGNGISGSSVDVRSLELAVNADNIAVSWTQPLAGQDRVYVKQFTGGVWTELNGSASGMGVSGSIAPATQSTIAYHGTMLFVGWVEGVSDSMFAGPTVKVSRFNGGQWMDATPDLISDAAVITDTPTLASGGNALYLSWTGRPLQSDHGHIADMPIFVARWAGNQFAEMMEGDTSGEGIHPDAVSSAAIRLTVDSVGQPYIVWQQSAGGDAPRIYLRGNVNDNTLTGRRFIADGSPGHSITDLLAAHDFGPGDSILITEDFGDDFVIGSDDAGVSIFAVAGRTVTGNVVVTASDVLLQNVTIDGDLVADGADRLTIRNSNLKDVVVRGGVDFAMTDSSVGSVTIESTATNTRVERNAVSAITLADAVESVIRFNQISGDTTGIDLISHSSGSIANNWIIGHGVGLRIASPFDGSIEANEIRDGQTGIVYLAAAVLSENRVRGNATGVIADVAVESDAFGYVGQSQPNVISENQVGVSLNGRMRGQIIVGNDVGVSGSGILGGSDLTHSNAISENRIGVTIEGEVRYNRIGNNTIGIDAQSNLIIVHNELADNVSVGVRVAAATDVQIIGNSMVAASGDNIQLSGGSKRVEIQNNVLWVDEGFNINVHNDSKVGFFSDFNTLHATGTGKLIHWSTDFKDLLDWQEDVHQFDLHSIGTTVINPNWSDPRFFNRSRGDLRVFELVGGQRFSSPTIGSANPLIDVGRSVTTADATDESSTLAPVNLLVNGDFEAGLAGWSTNNAASTQTSTPTAFRGAAYFAAGEVVVGTASQTIDLVAQQIDIAAVDAGALRLNFGGRLRNADETSPDRGKITVEMIDESGVVLTSAEVSASGQTDRWELIGAQRAIAPGTRTLRYSFVSTRNSGQTSDAYLDGAFARIIDLSYRLRAGAHAASPVESDPTAQPTIAIRFPDLYTDWEHNKPRTIRWASSNNRTDVPIRIDLYRASADGPEFLANIVDATPDDGAYQWTPENNGIVAGTHDLIIQVSRTDDSLIFDRSTETFSVPEHTVTFFVNDADLANDQYTSAVGSNRHTGRTPDSPKPYPNNILRIYSLGPNDVLNVDDGTYALLSPLIVSGAVDVGDDEGFLLKGPDAEGTRAVISHILTDRSEPLILLDDADLVTISHLELANALRGLHVVNDSTGLVLGHLVVSGHAEDGIRIEGNSNLVTGNEIDSSGNVGHGIYSENAVAVLSKITAQNNASTGISIGGVSDRIEDVDVSDNGASGLVIVGPTTLVQRVVANSNGGDGIRIQSGNVQLRSSEVANNANDGIRVSGENALIASNLVSGNLYDGIYASGSGTTVSGNTVWGQIAANRYGIYLDRSNAVGNVIFNNTNGIYQHGGQVNANRIYANTDAGVLARESGDLIGNVIYSNDVGIQSIGYGYNRPNRVDVRGNLIYGNNNIAVVVSDGEGNSIENNTIYQPQGDGIEIVGESVDVRLRNNLVVVASGTAISVDRLSQTGFDSDFNLLRHDGHGLTGRWGARDLDELSQWRIASFGDTESLADDPLFVDVDGADNSLGYVSVTNDGRDDDFHVSSSIGRFSGALAPVRSDLTGLPVDLPVSEFIDAVQSPAIDRGDELSPFDHEPQTNGGYVNLGAYGNTLQASKSPAEFLIVVAPNGGEAWPVGRTFDITWRSTQPTGQPAGFVNVDLIRDSDAGFVLPLVTAEMSLGRYQWTVPESVAVAGDYRIRLTRSDITDGLSDQSDVPLEITSPISVYYVNDGVDPEDEYTTAVGDDANDGLTPATPKASLRAILESGLLQPGDTVVVDHGSYVVDTNLSLGEALSGITIQGPIGTGATATLDRDNTNSGSYLFEFTGADDVTITGLTLTGAYDAIYADGNVDSNRIKIVGNTIAENYRGGVYAGRPNYSMLSEWTIATNTFYGSSYGVHLTQVDAVVENNIAFENNTGILINRYRDSAISLIAVGNEVYQNQTGIAVRQGAVATANIAYANATGIEASTSQGGLAPLANDNVAYGNDVGIRLQSRPNSGGRADAIGNKVFSNRVGIQADTYSYEGFLGSIQNNLVYDNQESGILIAKGIAGSTVVGNTVYQVSGNAISLQDESALVDFRNNILSVIDGYVFDFAADSEGGHSSDFNLFDLGENGNIAKLLSGEIATLDDWSYEFGHDVHSRSDDPQFVDGDGGDDVLGFSELPLAAPFIIDNGEAGFSTSGQWNNAETGYQGSSLVASDPGNLAIWTFEDLTPGSTYTVATTVGYVYPSTYDGQARFQIFAEARLSSLQHTNQRYLSSPDDFDFEDAGVGWNRLGYYKVGSDGTLRVELTGSGRAGEYQVADAIRIQQIVGHGADDDDFHLQPTSPGIDGGDPSFDVSAEPSPNGGRVNLGAYGGTAEATVSHTSPLIHLIDPAGPQKFRAGYTMPIRWLSETGSPVDLLLFAANGYTPGVSVPVHIIAEDLNTSDEYDWEIPAVPSFPTNQDYLIQVVETTGSSPADTSDVPVMIAGAGNTFYVNDDSLTGDSYTTAIGDNSNHGTSPDRPMATLQAVLNSYALSPGDVVYVDAGYYSQLRNILLDESFSGVTIQGPASGQSPATLDRRNKSVDTAVFEFIGADDVTIANLSITGADAGIRALGNVDSDRVHVVGNDIYDNERYGVQAGFLYSGNTLGEWTVSNNRIHGHRAAGVWFEETNGEIRDNVVFDNPSRGLLLSPASAIAGALVATGNKVTGSATGIQIAGGAIADGNTVHGNEIGIYVAFAGSNFFTTATNNTVYGNKTGIELRAFGRSGRSADAVGNRIFNNETGIHASGGTSLYNGFSGSIENNLIYANTGYAIEIRNAYPGTFVRGNTVRQTDGDAIHVKDISYEIDFRDNIFSVDDGFVFRFETDSQVGHSSDFNLFDLGAAGKIADFGWAQVETYEDWFYEAGFDANGQVGDPNFVDPDGADDILGYQLQSLGNAIIIDDGDAGFSTTGNWTALNRGYLNDSWVATGQSDRARWEFTGLTPGGSYQIAATVPYVSSPNDAQFNVYSDDIVVGAPRMNQSYVQTFDFVDAGVGWDELGIYRAGFDGTLRVELLAGDGQYDQWPSADAVRLESVSLYTGEDDDFHLQSDSVAIDAGDPNSDASAEPLPSGSRINQGAYGGTSEATTSASLETVHLDSPNGKDRYNVGQTLPIRWASQADGPVDIAIYRATGFQLGVSTPLALIADDLVSAGQFDWMIPSDGSIPAGGEYVIEVRSLGGTMPSTVSDQPFLIAPVGNEYFVNDGSRTGDVYTTAIGDNQNSGKAVDQPMASLAALLRVYSLEPGDTVFVDTGQYNLLSNIRLDDRFSGVTIKGPGNNMAVLDRQLTEDNAYLFEFVGADDVTLQGLSITGGQRGVVTEWDSQSHRIHLIGNEIYDNARSGISIARGYANTDLSGWVIRENQIHSNGGDGGVVVSGSEAEIVGNEIFGNSAGIIASGLQVDSNSILIHDNRVYENLSTGIHAERSTVTENEVFGNATGIFLSEADATDNAVYQNTDGIIAGNRYSGYNYHPDNQVRGNRVFANTGVGITFRLDGQLVGNYVYSNSVGILADNTLFYGEIANNLIYANTNQGIVVDGMYGGGDGKLLNNTVYQRVGDALRVEGGSKDLVARNNILIVDAGNAVSIAADSQLGLDLDWNLLQKGTDPNAHLGLWGSTIIDDLTAWQTTSSLDANSLTGDPGFLDIDGADNVLGFVSDNGGYDGGRDDNFYRTLHSIAIDRGDSWSAPHTDITGAERSDDLGTPNAGLLDYVESITPESNFAESGTGYELSSYDSHGIILPFPFDFYGRSFNSVTVSVSGYLHLDGPDYPSWGQDNDLNRFLHNATIAPAWDDFGRNPTEPDFYYDDTVADQVTVRWNGINTADESDINFSVTLFASGEIRFDYGSGNTNLTPTVGISAGDGLNYFLASIDGSSSLDSFESLSYTLAPGFTDLGAFEFQGNSNDTSPPTVVGSVPAGIHTGSIVVAETNSFVLQLSEPLNEIDANAPAAYSLLSAGADGVFGNLDDSLIDVVPSYQRGSTSVQLTTPTVLPDGHYRVTLFGQQTLHDQSGLRLDGDGDGNEGGNYVREFSITEDHPPTAADQTLTIDEDTEVAITLSGDDGNPTVLQSLRYVITSLPEDGTLATTPGGAAIIANQLPLLLDSAIIYFKPTENTHATSRFNFVTRDDDGLGIEPERTSSNATVTIDVTPVNDRPTIEDVNVSISEFSPLGAILTELVYSDPDLQDTAGDSHTLAITAGNDDAAFAINAAGQVILVDPARLDHESSPVRQLTVQVTDQAGLSDTATVTVNVQDALEAQVENVTLDDGTGQRSSIQSLTVRFNQLVSLDFSGGGPFVLTHVDSGDAVGTTAELFQVDGKTVVRLQFLAGPHVGATGSLNDGNYQLSVLSQRVSAAGHGLDGNADGTTGDDYVFGAEQADSFFRFFGDSDGDGDVDGQDYGRFGLTFLRQIGDPAYNPAMDFDQDGDVDGQDYGRFGLNFLRRR